MDLKIVESHDGGDVVLKGNDLVVTDSLFNQPYISLFGGNVEQSTANVGDSDHERNDFWGNSLLMRDNVANQFNSNFQKALQETVLNSSGITKLEAVVEEDLEHLKELARLTVRISLLSNAKIKIYIHLQEIETLEDQIFTYIWDATKLEKID